MEKNINEYSDATLNSGFAMGVIIIIVVIAVVVVCTCTDTVLTMLFFLLQAFLHISEVRSVWMHSKVLTRC